MNHKKSRILKMITVIFFCVCGICTLIGVFWQQTVEGEKWNLLAEVEEDTETEVTEYLSETLKQKTEATTKEVERVEASEQTKEEVFIYVHVCGAVAKENVYILPEGSRGIDAIQAAGGFAAEAATAYCNLAEVLTDGMRLYIPTQEEVNAGMIPVVSGKEGQLTGMVNINTAEKEELMTLPGIGESKAESIVKYRAKVGRFQTIEELKNVSGIGEALFESLCDKITV